MHIPQIIFIVLSLLGLGIEMEKHGQPKTGYHNFFIIFFVTVLQYIILYWGGFFSN